MVCTALLTKNGSLTWLRSYCKQVLYVLCSSEHNTRPKHFKAATEHHPIPQRCSWTEFAPHTLYRRLVRNRQVGRWKQRKIHFLRQDNSRINYDVFYYLTTIQKMWLILTCHVIFYQLFEHGSKIAPLVMVILHCNLVISQMILWLMSFQHQHFARVSLSCMLYMWAN